MVYLPNDPLNITRVRGQRRWRTEAGPRTKRANVVETPGRNLQPIKHPLPLFSHPGHSRWRSEWDLIPPIFGADLQGSIIPTGPGGVYIG